MESPTSRVDDPPLQNIASLHSLNDVLLEEGFWDDPLYPHLLGKDLWEENFFGQLNEHMASEDSIVEFDDLVKACDRFVAKWRAQQPGGRFLRRDKRAQLWNDVGDREAAAFISNRLADAYDIVNQFEAAEPRTVRQRVKYFDHERKTRVVNKSSRDIHVIIADGEVTYTLSMKDSTGVSVPFVEIRGELGGESEVGPPLCLEDMVLAGKTEDFELNQRKYYLTVFTKDAKNNFIVHVKNRRVLAMQDWVFEEEDLKKVLESLEVSASDA